MGQGHDQQAQHARRVNILVWSTPWHAERVTSHGYFPISRSSPLASHAALLRMLSPSRHRARPAGRSRQRKTHPSPLTILPGLPRAPHVLTSNCPRSADKAARCTFERRRGQRRRDSNNPWDGQDCLNTFTINYYCCDNQWARAFYTLWACLLTKLVFVLSVCLSACLSHARQFICIQSLVVWPGGVI